MKTPFLPILLCLAESASAAPLVRIDTVPIGSPGNPAASEKNVTYDPDAYSAALGYGAVAQSYRIGRTEVTIAEYNAFLNAVASIPEGDHIADLWNSNMDTDGNVAGIRRSGSGTAANPYVYTVVAGSENRPITYVSWLDAARFVNWLQNGATSGSGTETGAYTLDGATSGTFPRNADASWWLPSEDEWYKAAYYSPLLNGGGGYTLYANQSNTLGSNAVGSSGGANYRENGVYATTQDSAKLPNQNYLTDVGSYPGSASYYETFDQNGNAWEWTDTSLSDSRYRIRNGSWIDEDASLLGAAGSFDAPSALELFDIGFRVAATSDPPASDTAAPRVAISGKKRRSTPRARILLAGKASDDVATALVEVKVGPRRYRAANGTDAWKFRANLRRGKNTIRVRARDTSGNISQAEKLTIRRK